MLSRLIVLTCFCACPIMSSAQPDTLWTKLYTGNNVNHFYSCKITSDNGIILAGTMSATFSGQEDLWVVKTDSCGEMIWECFPPIVYYGASMQNGPDVCQSMDGGYLVLYGPSNYYGYNVGIVKLDSAGNFLWNQSYTGLPNTQSKVYRIFPDVDGGFKIWFESYWQTTYFTWRTRLTLVKADSIGQEQWRTYHLAGEFGDSTIFGEPKFYEVCKTADGGFILAGYNTEGDDSTALLKTDSTGRVEWYNQCMPIFPNGIIQANDHGYLLAGSAGNYDTIVYKTDSLGYEDWYYIYSGGDHENSYGLTLSSDGGVVIIGYQNWYDGLLWKVKMDGQLEWADIVSWGWEVLVRYKAIQNMPDGGYVVAGWLIYDSSYQDSCEALIVRYENDPVIGVIPFDSTEFLNMPNTFSLSPPHPNPFNPTTQITFTLPVASNVTIDLFDINGRKITSHQPLNTNDYYTPGSHTITFDGGDLPSGIYFARLTAGDFQQTQKLVLLK